jgi:hypothetical protein
MIRTMRVVFFDELKNYSDEAGDAFAEMADFSYGDAVYTIIDAEFAIDEVQGMAFTGYEKLVAEIGQLPKSVLIAFRG